MSSNIESSSSTFIVKSGWLTKQGYLVANWKRRFFRLDNKGNMCYYNSPQDELTSPCGKFNITSVVSLKIEEPTNENGIPGPCLHIEMPERTYHLVADTVEEIQHWMSAIHLVFDGQIVTPEDRNKLLDFIGRVDLDNGKPIMVDFDLEEVLEDESESLDNRVTGTSKNESECSSQEKKQNEFLLAIVDKVWEDFQQRFELMKTLTKWVNYHLKGMGLKPIQQLASLTDGVALLHLCEELSHKPIEGATKEGNSFCSSNQIQNVNILLHFLSSEYESPLTLNVASILAGNLKSITSLVWSIFVHYELSTLVYKDFKGIDALIRWFNDCTSNYPSVHISDFSKSFEDGLAICALIHHHKPSSIHFYDLASYKKYDNWELALSVAEKEWGIPKLLDIKGITTATTTITTTTTTLNEVGILIYVTICMQFLTRQ